MANYDIHQVHQAILGICKALDKVCADHNLTYYLWAGSMIGAVRHHGFIPWDDDMDVAMPRPDYDKLIAHCAEWLPKPYEMVCAEDDASYPLPFAKIQDASTTLIERAHLRYLGGVYLDVFPIDGVPAGRVSQLIHFGRYEYYKRLLYLVHRDPYKHGHGPSCWMPLIVRHLYTMKGLQQKIRRLLHSCNYEQSRLVADYDDGSKGTMLKEILGKPTNYQFEGCMLKGVEHYDEYLTNKYGDYMKLPDAEHQRQHNFHYLDLNHPYRSYRQRE